MLLSHTTWRQLSCHHHLIQALYSMLIILNQSLYKQKYDRNWCGPRNGWRIWAKIWLIPAYTNRNLANVYVCNPTPSLYSMFQVFPSETDTIRPKAAHFGRYPLLDLILSLKNGVNPPLKSTRPTQKPHTRTHPQKRKRKKEDQKFKVYWLPYHQSYVILCWILFTETRNIWDLTIKPWRLVRRQIDFLFLVIQ